MKALKVKPLSAYLRQLERMKSDIVGEQDVAGTAYEHEDLTLYTQHADNQTVEGRIAAVTHEVTHHVHKIWKVEDADKNTAQEAAIDKVVDDLVSRPEWCVAVVYWLEGALFDAYREAVNGSGLLEGPVKLRHR